MRIWLTGEYGGGEANVLVEQIGCMRREGGGGRRREEEGGGGGGDGVCDAGLVKGGVFRW